MEEILYTIIMAIAFLIPGFIITSITKRIIPLVDREYKTRIFENFIYSFLNIFLWSIPIYRIYLNIEFWKDNYILLWIIIFIIVFLSPIAIALIVILFNQYEIIRKMCEYFNIRPVDTEPSAWDFKFKRIKSEWVLITLSNERTVAGFIGENSFISSNFRERDVYIDKVYEIDENGKWNKRKETDGIWIKNEEIRSIEFFYCEKGENKNEEKSRKQK